MGLYVLGLMEGGPASRSQKIQVCVHKLLFEYDTNKYTFNLMLSGMFESVTQTLGVMLLRLC